MRLTPLLRLPLSIRRIPPGELLRANPALFLQVKLSCDMTKDDWHAFYDRVENASPQIRRVKCVFKKGLSYGS